MATDYGELNNNEFFDFENTDSFLNSLSGAVQSLSPESLNGSVDGGSYWGNDPKDVKTIGQDYIDQSTKQFEQDFLSDFSHELSGSESANTYNSVVKQDYDADFTGVMKQEYDNDYPGVIKQEYDNDYPQFQALSIPSNTYSNDSSELTPVSQPSLSSAQTSPEVGKHSDYEDMAVKKVMATSHNINPKSKVTKPKKDKTSHNMIEKKYRSNINSKILALRDAVPSLKIASGSNDVSIADLEGLTPASKLNKASVLTKATEYIKHLEKKNELLRNQNLELQRLIHEANMNPNAYVQPQPIHQQPIVPNGQQQGPQANYMSNDSSYSGNIVYNNHHQQQKQPNKYLMGGMAAVVATSFLGGSGDTEFRGMSAIPLIPLQALNGPVVQVWKLLKLLLIAVCLANVFLPDLIDIFSKSDKKTSKSLWKTWIQVNLGLKVPPPIEPEAKQAIVNRLLGKDKNAGYWQLFRDYVQLSSSEATFENCLLVLIVGSILSTRFSFISSFLKMNLSIRSSLISNLDYTGDVVSLKALQKLIKDLDGVNMFSSDTIISRLDNLVFNNTLSLCDGQNNLKFIELLQQNREDYYSLVLSWRILALCNDLNIAYLEDPSNENIEKDLQLISELLNENLRNTRIGQYFNLFKTALKPNKYVIDLMQYTRKDIDTKLTQFNFLMNGRDLTDDEAIEDSQDEEENESSGAEPSELNSVAEIQPKKLIQELNLISEEQFIILASSLVRYYFNKKDNEKANVLLKYLKFNSENLPLSLLSFTALYAIIEELVTENNQFANNEILDQLIRIAKNWIDDDRKGSFLSVKFRSSLSDRIINKGILLNGGNEVEEY